MSKKEPPGFRNFSGSIFIFRVFKCEDAEVILIDKQDLAEVKGFQMMTLFVSQMSTFRRLCRLALLKNISETGVNIEYYQLCIATVCAVVFLTCSFEGTLFPVRSCWQNSRGEICKIAVILR